MYICFLLKTGSLFHGFLWNNPQITGQDESSPTYTLNHLNNPSAQSHQYFTPGKPAFFWGHLQGLYPILGPDQWFGAWVIVRVGDATIHGRK